MVALLAPHPLIITALFLSIAGLPPFLGFYLKLY
jgi:NADH:ubiquinone oxidoreductase subunit 2 (subunit N)